MDNVILAMQVSRGAEAARAAGISVTPNPLNEHLDVESPEGLTVLAGNLAADILREARKLWGVAGVVSFQTALLYCTALYLSQRPPA